MSSSYSTSLQLSSLEKLRLPPLDAGERADVLPPDDVRSALSGYTCTTRSDPDPEETTMEALSRSSMSATTPFEVRILGAHRGAILAPSLRGKRDGIGGSRGVVRAEEVVAGHLRHQLSV